MRVLWLAHRDPENPRAGGAERTIYEVGRRLAARGHEVVLVTVRWRGSRPRAILDEIDVRRYSGNMEVHIALPYSLQGKNSMLQSATWGTRCLGIPSRCSCGSAARSSSATPTPGLCEAR